MELINNAFYDELGERWYRASDDPIALLRAENHVKGPWIGQVIRENFGTRSCSILDVACGAGFLSNELARLGHQVTGIDLSQESLAVAADYDLTATVQYRVMDATALQFKDESFDVICAMDFLEHVPNPEKVVQQCAIKLKPGGLFFFHTFNRNPVSRLIVIKGVEWFVKNTPEHLHVYELFVKPSELRRMCEKHGLRVEHMRGVRPKLRLKPLLELVRSGTVAEDFEFTFTRSLMTGYLGYARKF